MAVKEQIDAIELTAFVPYQISVLADLIARRASAITKSEAGLNLSQWRVLAAVADRPGRTANEVTAATPMDKGIVSRAVKTLLEMGLIVRKASQEDGRLAHLHLTSRGKRTYSLLAAKIKEIDRQMSRGATKKNWKQLSLLLNSVTDELKE